jgi:hypothetical protein
VPDMGRNSLRQDATCGCGLYIHPSQRVLAWHIPDCEYFSSLENHKVEEENRRLQRCVKED